MMSNGDTSLLYKRRSRIVRGMDEVSSRYFQFEVLSSFSCSEF
jgi:hypothetical protein